MSMRFSVFPKVLAMVLVLLMLANFLTYAHGDHGSDPCADELDDYHDALRLLGIVSATAIAVCSPASLATLVGGVVCATAIATLLYQRSEVEEARWEWEECQRENNVS